MIYIKLSISVIKRDYAFTGVYNIMGGFKNVLLIKLKIQKILKL